MADLRIYRDLDAVSQAFVEELERCVPMILHAQDRMSIALSGGSTPRRLFQMLAARPESLPWERIDLYWGDERAVGPDHPDSNYKMAKDELLDKLVHRKPGVHRVRGEGPNPQEAAEDYDKQLRKLAQGGKHPVFDYILLGMGADGHTASLFPHSPALDEVTRSFVAHEINSPLTKGRATRLTMTAAAINWARRVRFLITGADKAAALAEVLEGERDPRRLPAQLIAPKFGTLVWYVDEAASDRCRRKAS